MSADPRGRRIAVVADSLLEPLLDELGAQGYGIVQLPPAGLDAPTTAAWLEQVAEHVTEFRRNDYEVVLLSDGSYDDELAPLGLPQYAIQPPSTSRLTPDT
ncbi:MAG: hypothetical protein QOK22_866 [Gaiellaceae bacterium]|nr:hypothetical protein [Gaiellaceae bacterium]